MKRGSRAPRRAGDNTSDRVTRRSLQAGSHPEPASVRVAPGSDRAELLTLVERAGR